MIFFSFFLFREGNVAFELLWRFGLMGTYCRVLWESEISNWLIYSGVVLRSFGFNALVGVLGSSVVTVAVEASMSSSSESRSKY